MLTQQSDDDILQETKIVIYLEKGWSVNICSRVRQLLVNVKFLFDKVDV